MKRLLFLLLVTSVGFCSNAQTPYDAFLQGTKTTSAMGSSSVRPYSAEFSYSAASSVNIQFPGFALTADNGSLNKDLTIHATVISREGGQAMPSDMENVSRLSDGVRLLPNGVHFSDTAPALIALAYDPERIPRGYRPDDVYTFYCDDSHNWYRLERVGIDTTSHVITSLTTHFTDFANAVIKVPEMPESTAFVPTEMQDLPDPDPLTGVPMIEVPRANNMGTAELTYPIPLPPGRHGLQPNMDLHYSSTGGNGLLGVGWSIEQPAITIDTRWGVPRYDLKDETEAYLVNGEPVLLHDRNGHPIPLPHMSSAFEPRRAQATQFFARDQRNQSKIVRHGQRPDRYWWSVITTEGVIYYYGYNPFTQSIDEQSVIRTAQNNIGYWALTYIMDRFGNYVQYSNIKDTDNNVRIYCISYTGHSDPDLAPYYNVYFQYSSRPDIQSDARLGVLRKQTQRLCQIRVQTATNEQLATYRFAYSCCPQSLFKLRLDSIIKFDGDIKYYLQECDEPIYHTEVDNYSEKWIDEENQLYADITQDGDPQDQKPASITRFKYADAFPASSLYTESQILSSQFSAFSASRSEGWNLGGAVTIGWGHNVAKTSVSGGANYAYERNKGVVKMMLIDLNGDGLLDHLSVSGHSVLYRKQRANHTFEDPVPVNGLSRLSREVSSSHTFGAQLDCFANLSYNPSISNSYTDVYFADINADGLPDLVTPSGVKLNTLLSSGIPSFSDINDTETALSVHGNYCDRAIHYGGEVDSNLMCDIHYVLIDSLPLSSILPGDGEGVFIEGEMEPDKMDEEKGEIEPREWNPLPIRANGDSKFVPDTFSVSDKIQDAFAKDMVAKQVDMRPVTWENWRDILQQYYSGDDYTFELGDSVVYVYHKEYICERDPSEPNVDIVRVWVSDRSDSVCLNSLFLLREDTSYMRSQARYADGVRLRIQWNKGVYEQNGHLYADSVQMLFDGTVHADNYDSLRTSFRIMVQENDIVFFRLGAREDRRFDNADWVHTVTTTANDTLYNSARDYICTGQQNFVAPATGTALVSVSCDNAGTVPMKVRVMHQTDTILYFTLPALSVMDTAITRAVTDTDVIAFYADTLVQEPLWSEVRIVPSVGYWGTLQVDTPTYILPDTLYYHPDIQLQYSSLYADSVHICRRLFGPLHKGWGQFAYHNINNDSLIALSVLVNEEDSAATYVHENQSQYATYNPEVNVNDPSQMAYIEAHGADQYFSAINAYNPLADDKRWIAMRADNTSGTWQAYGNTGSIGQTLHSTSRQLETVADTAFIAEEIPEYDSPVPAKYGNIQRITTIRKSTHSVQHSLTTGMHIPLLGIGVSDVKTWGSYSVTSDYMDMNGDGFPDFVGKSAVQYTKPWGGIGELKGVLPQAFSSENSSIGKGFSASRPEPEHAPGNGVKDSKMYFGGIGGGINGQIGYDHTNISYMDINADGLPDMVDAANERFKYNLGYEFDSNWTSLSSLSISSSSHHSISLNASTSGTFEEISDAITHANGKKEYSLCQYSISGGFSASASENITDIRLLDINGDGYPDMLTDNGSTIQVRYFTGTSFTPPDTVNIPNLQRSSTANVGANLGVTAGFSLVLFPVKFCFGVHTTPWTVSSTVGNTDFMDVDGDGYVDQVLSSDGTLKVRYNRNGSVPVNLLTSVTNPTGQQITIVYVLTAPSTDHRTRVWRMNTVHDTIPTLLDTTKNHGYDFEYSGAFYDNFERTENGCEQVLTHDEGTKHIQELYENRYYILRGEKKADLCFTPSYAPIIGHRHETGFYDFMDVYSPSVCEDINLHVGTEGYYTDYYEGEHDPVITTRYMKYYDNRHNLIRYEDNGDLALGTDDWIQTIAYKPHTTYNLRLPSVERVFDDTHQLLRKRRINYNTYGQAVQIIAEDSLQNSKAIHRLWYDNFNCVGWLRDPLNGNGEWSWRCFEYDHTTHTHITRIRNQFSETRYFGYDLRHGVRNWSRDAAGNEMIWRYDRMGRLIDIVAPEELVNNRPYSVHYIYRLPDHNQATNAPHPYIYPHVTKIAADSAIVSIDVTLYDARGQHLQRKSWRYIRGEYNWVTDGLRYNNPWYRPYRTYDPFITDFHIVPLWEVDTMLYLHYPTDYAYDNLNRNVKVCYPDGTSTSTNYHFAHDLSGAIRLRTNHTDENLIKTDQLYAPQGWTVQTIAGDSSITFYDYNPLGELVHAIDADHYHTTYQYDMYGNRVERSHPDAGKTIWTYAPNGSLIRKQTARLGIINDSIRYHYYFDKLMRIIYPNVYNNVYYQYDYAGRMAWCADATGSTRLYYDAMGNVCNTIRRIIMPTEDFAYSFRTETKYDSFGRIRQIVYPDAEQVDYLYYHGGGLESVWRTQFGHAPQPIVRDMQYDPMDHNIYRIYGNSVWSDYNYEPYRNRLAGLRTYSPSSCMLQDIKYSYDNVGNILYMQQLAPACIGMGGEYDNIYKYDLQYRLVKSGCAMGNYQYDIDMAYSRAGRLGHNWGNNSSATSVMAEYGYDKSRYTHQPRVVFDYKSEISASLFWDANGNLAQVNYCKLEQGRFHDWDEENRLRMVVGNKQAGYYGYDANNERVYKLTGESTLEYVDEHKTHAGVLLTDATLYPNPYIVITPKGYTKHYYANGERLATVLGQGGFGRMYSDVITHFNDTLEENLWGSSFKRYENEYPFEYFHETYPVTNPNVDIADRYLSELQYKCGEYHLSGLSLKWDKNILLYTIEAFQTVNDKETDIFYTHNNHLGSAAWITRFDGKPVQYMHYLPYGQLLANQNTAGYDERYKFIGKERDYESGYDFFGTRFYIPPFIHFASVEPLLDKYLHISPYSYAAWNPIKYVDYNGMDVYRYDDQTGDFKLYQNTDDNFDQIGQLKYDRKTREYKPRLNKDGSIKTYSDHLGNNDKIAKGILRDGLNIRQNGSRFFSDDEIGPSLTDFYNFALILDEVTGVEISGYVFENLFLDNKRIVQLEPYKKNFCDKSKTRMFKSLGWDKAILHFHTHGHAYDYFQATTPSSTDDIPTGNKLKKQYPGIQLYILHNYGTPIQY